MAIDYNLSIIIDSGSRAAIETETTLEDSLPTYREERFTYIPLPVSNQYYNVELDEFHELNPDQYIHPDASIRGGLEKLSKHPFLLLEMSSEFYEIDGELVIASRLDTSENKVERIGDLSDAIERYPGRKREILDQSRSEGLYRIFTVADVNRREVKDEIYPAISEVESRFAEEIKQSNKKLENLYKDLSPSTIGRWKTSEFEGIQMDISEYMTLSEMVKIIGKDDGLRSAFGYSSRNQFDGDIGGILDLRNKIMHASRTLVHNRDDLERLVERLARIENIIQTHGGTIRMKYSKHFE